MSYMDMNPALRTKLAYALIAFNFILVAANISIGWWINLIGSTTIPLMLNVVPGYLYFKYERDQRPEEQKWTSIRGIFALAFAFLGGMMMLIYISLFMLNESDTFDNTGSK